ncbi:hypothetical protein TVAG_486200 [Trichomonas vaginalis G3]|uniref:Integral membrane protein n=1 Tax=Trichomonas vaginalis (strain ATCC PRA-98 / G3) TaxID=412133 RepID=A2EEG7_TRIV3|nr:solute carrier family 35 member F6 family [Trichomonas vaginalis G3]EAY08973.1 hypothetical protein TVAG_486200 [Trichomonas vaginalis G3]KAI5508579.1 solute carrier family 35 member F6 family [Trichomonas vaginalis G3]|eukprot:XP_001321196.1 hypothetical protein [Trichomonas vaginalis G3]
MEKEVDFGKPRRILYITGSMLGSLASYYMRTLFYSRQSRYKSGCPYINFDRPWIGTLVMTIGISICTLVYYIQTLIDPKNYPKITHIPLYIYLMIVLPALLDILISAIYSFAISENTGSISIAIRYFDLLFVIIIQNIFMTPIHYAYQWFALGIVTLGIIFVSIGVLLGSQFKAKLLPTILQLIAQLIMSIRTIIIQKILHENDVSPWLFTGIDGIYGFLLVLFGFYPIANFLPEHSFASLHESFCSSILLTFHSLTIILLFLIYIPITCVYNGCTTGTIMTTNAVGFTIVEMISGSIAWIIDLIIYHAFNGKFILRSDEKFGVRWTDKSYFRLIGSLTFLLGGAIYLKIIKFPCFKYPAASVTKINISETPSEVNFEV